MNGRMSQSPFVWQMINVSGCNCLHVSVFVKNLSELGVWPISTTMTNVTLAEIYRSLRHPALFQNIPVKIATDTALARSCPACKRGFNAEIEEIIKTFWEVLQGLCLDCLKGNSCVSEERAGKPRAVDFDWEVMRFCEYVVMEKCT
jgi:hypothetical protein